MAMQPHSHGANGYPICTNGLCTGGLVGLQQQPQPQQPPQPQQQPPQHQPQGQGHVVPIGDPRVRASINFNTPAIATRFEKQRQEVYQFINMQTDQLKEMLQRQLLLPLDMIRSMEKLAINLENDIRELKKIVEEKEATIITLYNNLEEEKKKLRMLVENDVGSSCGENEVARHEKIALPCQNCKTKPGAVLFLPCWHLSSCKACATLLQACPICGTAKNDVVEVQNLILY